MFPKQDVKCCYLWKKYALIMLDFVTALVAIIWYTSIYCSINFFVKDSLAIIFKWL